MLPQHSSTTFSQYTRKMESTSKTLLNKIWKHLGKVDAQSSVHKNHFKPLEPREWIKKIENLILCLASLVIEYVDAEAINGFTVVMAG